MTGRPYIICHMISSIDGSLHPSRYTASPDGERSDWSKLYDDLQTQFAANGWLIGRTTMAEMAKGQPHPPYGIGEVARPRHFANRGAKSFAIAVDLSAKLHFRANRFGDDHIVVLLGHDVPDAHLAELASDGISYVVAEEPKPAIGPLLEVLRRELGIERLLLEGGGATNGAFLAEGLVDELSVLIAPALDARIRGDGTFTHGLEGLQGKVTLSLLGSELAGFGVVHLRYVVSPA
jgi:riboflavin biosynthesis pyrimidine reductase